jgi:hypothetical protein
MRRPPAILARSEPFAAAVPMLIRTCGFLGENTKSAKAMTCEKWDEAFGVFRGVLCVSFPPQDIKPRQPFHVSFKLVRSLRSRWDVWSRGSVHFIGEPGLALNMRGEKEASLPR